MEIGFYIFYICSLKHTFDIRETHLKGHTESYQSTLTSQKELEKILAIFTESYQDTVAHQEETEKQYYEKLDMLKVAPVEQRKELLIETQLLNDEVNNLSNEVKEQYSQMDKVNKLLQEHTTAQDSLRKAESILSTLKNQIECFMQKHSLTLV